MKCINIGRFKTEHDKVSIVNHKLASMWPCVKATRESFDVHGLAKRYETIWGVKM